MIELQNATKYYDVKDSRNYILKEVSLTIPSGKNLAIIGRNGAGKSTLLRMLGGIDFPNTGTITSPNTFSWPMGLSGGFQGSMTGRQNVKFVCRIYGKSAEEIAKAIAYVYEFSELGHYFDMPIKSYSSGMKSKLSFGLSLAFDFDYLLIDETLAVGDTHFREKSQRALKEKIASCNILLVNHGPKILKDMCDTAIVLHQGELHYFDSVDEGLKIYNEFNK